MYRRFSDFVLLWARVRPEPEPPLGAPGSGRTFRAGKNYYYLRLFGWGATQIGAAIGLTFSIGFVASLDTAVRAMVLLRSRPVVAASPTPTPSDTDATPIAPDSPSPSPSASTVGSDLNGIRDFSDARDVMREIDASATAPDEDGAQVETAPTAEVSPTPSRRSRARRNTDGIARVLRRMPDNVFQVITTWIVPLVFFLEYVGIAMFLVFIPSTYGLARIEYEQHWYIVTDRSLRIRTGVLSLSESTMSFANIQQVEVKQGPLQRLLGLADVRVQSAGGGSTDEHGGDALHTGVFRSVENAEEIRDLIVARLRAFREAGLGDPDQKRGAPTAPPDASTSEALAAAREVLDEARALRSTASEGR